MPEALCRASLNNVRVSGEEDMTVCAVQSPCDRSSRLAPLKLVCVRILEKSVIKTVSDSELLCEDCMSQLIKGFSCSNLI